MKYSYIKKDSGKKTHWSGGLTEEYAIFPQNGNYSLRSFIWRLSSSTIENDDSTFTSLPEFDRIIMVLNGEVDLSYDDNPPVHLKQYDTDSFGGEQSTKSKGKISDYNLIIRKGNTGFINTLKVTSAEGNTVVVSSDVENKTEKNYDNVMNSYYCAEGYAVANFNNETIMLKVGDQLIIERTSGEKFDLSFLGDAVLLKVSAFYSYNSNAYGPTIIPPETVSVDDYLACLYIANTQFRYAEKIFKSLNKFWYDEFINLKIKKLEKYCVTSLIWLIGAMFLLVAFYDNLSGFLPWFILIAVWTVFDAFVVSPLIYILVLPKPVAKHIKAINDLTPYEADLYEKEKNTNEQLEKILKKYKHVCKDK
ncbi:MAG: HutD family protein [Peptostreptococcaceae bacterium]|nr:HutD family protein [Peptostreptococcaceae bacterium]